MAPRVVLTYPTCAVLLAMASKPGHEWFGLELARVTGEYPGTVYPILRRLCGQGMLTARPEGVDPRAAFRAARIYYRLTPAGLELAREAVEWLRQRSSFTHRPPPAES